MGDLTTSLLVPGQPLPLVVTAPDDIPVEDLATEHRPELDRLLAEHGAILFRGFAVATPDRMAAAAEALCDTLFDDNGEHAHDPVAKNVYTPVEYSATQTLLWHNENTFNLRWPRKLLFACAVPAAIGGETPIVDTRRVLAGLDPAVCDAFLAEGVTYVRGYGGGLGLDWQQVFRTDDRATVEERCREEGFEYRWLPDGGLRTRCLRPAAVAHPVTGEAAWVNQAQHWHPSCLDPDTYEALLDLFGEDELPRDCRLGRDGRISAETMRHILDVYAANEVVFPWEEGDLLVIDNIAVAHGRRPFTGARRILVALGEMTSFGEVAAVTSVP